MGIKPWETNGGNIYPEDLNYFIRMKSLEGQKGDDAGFKKVS